MYDAFAHYYILSCKCENKKAVCK